jgi:hypothetical protein
MDDASTRSSLVNPALRDLAKARTVYYAKPVANYLASLGCREPDLSDLSRTILEELATTLLSQYDPRTPFRPFFTAFIVRVYTEHRAKRRKRQPASAPPGAPTQQLPEVLLDGMRGYARQIHDQFRREAPQELQAACEMLHAWIIDGERQDRLAHRWQVADRTVRTRLGEASDALAQWIDRRLHPDDRDELVALAIKHGMAMRREEVENIRDWLSHASRDKRKRALLLLWYIHQQGR